MVRIIKNINAKCLKLSIRTYLFLLSLMLVLIFLSVLSYISYNTTTSIIMKRIESIDESNLRQINNKITFAVGEIEKITKSFARSDSLIDLLKEYKSNSNAYHGLLINEKIKPLLNEFKLIYDSIDSIEIYSDGIYLTESGITSTESYDIEKSDIYQKIKASQNNLYIFEPFTNDAILPGNFCNITFGSIIYDGKDELGIIFVIMKLSWFNDLFKNEKDVIISTSTDGSVLWASSSKIINDFHDCNMFNLVKYKEGSFLTKDYRALYMKLRYNNWIIITLKRISDISAPANQVRNYVFIATISSTLISFLLAHFISKQITKPISGLINVVQRYKVQKNIQYNSQVMSRFSLRKTTMIYFILVVTIPMLIYTVMFYFTSSRVIENKVKESILQVFEQTTDNIDSFIAINERISVKILTGEHIQKYLVLKNEGKYFDEQKYMGKISRSIDDSLMLSDNIFEICIYDLNKNVLLSTSFPYLEEGMNETLYDIVNPSYGNPIWVEYSIDRYNKNVIKLVRKIYSIRDDKYAVKNLGFISMTYYESNIEELYRDISFADNSVYLIDTSGMIISHRSKVLLNQMSIHKPDSNMSCKTSNVEKNGRQYLVIYAACSKLPWYLVGEIDYREIRKDNNVILVTSIYTIIILLLILPILSYVFSKFLTTPINSLNRKLAELAKGNMDIDFTEKVYVNEIDELGIAFNDMANRIKALIETVYVSQIRAKELEGEKKDAELIALQAQINPHFLYNTIESIKWMICGNKKENAIEMLTLLSDLFRLGISRENKVVSIEEEIKYTEAYIQIQKLRLGSKVNFWWSIDKRVLEFMVPKLILQPIIENAIKHGIQKKESGGNISISCNKENELVIFKVMDDGMGINKNELTEIQNVLEGDMYGKSIGIFNVHKRVQLFFGKEYGVTVESSYGTGTIVRIEIPQIKIEDLANHLLL